MSQPEIGELFVGAYLRIVKQCPIVQYNARDEARGSQSEVDVLGINYAKGELYVCEVITHLGGALYSGKTSGDETVERVDDKFTRHKRWVVTAFPQFPQPVFMLWSPYVAVGAKTEALDLLASKWNGPGVLELHINASYADAMRQLMDVAATQEKDRGEVFYRVLQLLTHLRGTDNHRLMLRLE